MKKNLVSKKACRQKVQKNRKKNFKNEKIQKKAFKNEQS